MTELERNKRISEEYQRISIYFESLDENERAVIDPLIRNAAFMRVTLDDLQVIIAEQGPIEGYQNGANQFGTKQSAALQSYNATMKVYAGVIKNLFSQLPPMQRPSFNVGKTAEQLADERRQDEERRKAKAEELEAAIAFQKWQRAEEAAGRKPTKGFGQWRQENGL